jgi:hypothetical protein
MDFKLNPQKPVLPKVFEIISLLVLFFLSVLILSNSMLKHIEHDEQMYCTAGVLLAQGKMIYRDFSYVAQLPYHPLLCAVLFKILGTTYYLLTARLLSSVCDIIVMICIFTVYRRAFGFSSIAGTTLGLTGALLYIFNSFVSYANGFAWNHDVVIASVMVSLLLYQTIDSPRNSGYWRIAVIGGLLTFATFMRSTTALVQVLFLAFLLKEPVESTKQKLKRILSFLAACCVVSLWPVYIILQAPQAFLLNVFRIPVLNGRLLNWFGAAYGKLEIVVIFLTEPDNALLIMMALFLLAALFLNRRKLNLESLRQTLLPPVCLTAILFIIAFIPLTMWLQYFAVPVPFMIVSFAYPLGLLKKLTDRRYFKTAGLLMAALVLTTVFYNPVGLYGFPRFLSLRNWTPIELHTTANDISANTEGQKRILTLAPLLALEGGCKIYDEFSAGVFAFRVADYLSYTERKITHTVGLSDLKELTQNSKPSAVILKVEPNSLEAPILENVIAPERDKWIRKDYNSGPAVYFRR